MTSAKKLTASQKLRKKIGKLDFNSELKKNKEVNYLEFVKMAKKAAKTFEKAENESNSRRPNYL